MKYLILFAGLGVYLSSCSIKKRDSRIQEAITQVLKDDLDSIRFEKLEEFSLLDIDTLTVAERIGLLTRYSENTLNIIKRSIVRDSLNVQEEVEQYNDSRVRLGETHYISTMYKESAEMYSKNLSSDRDLALDIQNRIDSIKNTEKGRRSKEFGGFIVKAAYLINSTTSRAQRDTSTFILSRDYYVNRY